MVLVAVWCFANQRTSLKVNAPSAVSILFIMLIVFTTFHRSSYDYITDIEGNFIVWKGVIYETGFGRSGMQYTYDLIACYVALLIASLFFAKYNRFNMICWWFIVLYLLSFIARSSLDLQALRDGPHLGAGLVLITLMPFIFLQKKAVGIPWIPLLILTVSIFWLSIIGARMAALSLILFLFLLITWPVLVKTKLRFYLLFFFTLSIVILFNLALIYMEITLLKSELMLDRVEFQGVENISFFNVLNKGFSGRADIWLQLLTIISEKPFFGFGADMHTMEQLALPGHPYTVDRYNLASHSTYFEILYRLGILGVLNVTLIMFFVWKAFAVFRLEWPVRVAGASLIMFLVFGTTSQTLIFSETPLRAAFSWLVVGVGLGACKFYQRLQKKQVTVVQ